MMEPVIRRATINRGLRTLSCKSCALATSYGTFKPPSRQPTSRNASSIAPVHLGHLHARLQLGEKIGITHPRLFHTSRVDASHPTFSYGVAAAFTAKDTRFNPAKNVFNFNSHNPIHKHRKDKNTRPQSGQDAFFISRIGESEDLALGVADGVGGWIDSGVDPADFSHGFCDYMAHTAYTYMPGEKSQPLTARSLMQKGYDEALGDRDIGAGGSTACVGLAKTDGSLEVANLGDSGFLQLRLNAVHNYSEPQTHAFNTPYQLSIIPEKMKARTAVFGGTQLQDFPKDATVTKHSLRHGDVLIFATDGVWDNLSSSDILKIVSRLMIGSKAWQHTEGGISVGDRLGIYTMLDNPPDDAQDIPSLQSFLAIGITGEAKAASVNTKVDGPFAREVQKKYPEENWRGGKVDDICVVVAIVVEDGK